MAILKCKICGGDLEINEALSVYECQHCGVRQTIPAVDDEDKVKLYNRANSLRLKCEFDKAAGVYETIVSRFPDEAEAYWGLVLCKYGIEYVEDSNGSRIPTCHRTLPVSVMEDSDFDLSCTNADIEAKIVYREEAKVIDAIQKKILEIAAAESPYDVFICYKERDDSTSQRTEDSNIAQDIYTELTQQGYRVFYARITLRELAGSEYEPYIYAALSSAKVMVAIGTKFAYYDAVWVKNEWSRFISMMHEDNSKILIPCYKNMDAYDIPKEFRNMQALDIGDLTFLDSLKANIKRIISKGSHQETIIKEAAATNKRESISNYLKRISMFLEDRNIASANEYCEKILDLDPENGDAYFYKFMLDAGVTDMNRICDLQIPLNNYPSFIKALRFGNDEQVAFLRECENRVFLNYCEKTYGELLAFSQTASTAEDWVAIANGLSNLGDFKDSQALVKKASEKIESLNKQAQLKEQIANLEEEINCTNYIGDSIEPRILPFIFKNRVMRIIFIIIATIWGCFFAVLCSDDYTFFDFLGEVLRETIGGDPGGIFVLVTSLSVPGVLAAGVIEVIVRGIITIKNNIIEKGEAEDKSRKLKLDKLALDKDLRNEEETYKSILFKS